MLCPICKNETRKFGKNRNGSQRYRCDECRKTFTDETTRTDNRRVEKERIFLAIRMLLEGNSIRAVERLMGIHRDTIIAAMVDAGGRCKRFLEKAIRNVPVTDVQCDEIWGFVNCKEKTRIHKYYVECGLGDAWCFTAFERHTKLILTFHVGKRTPNDTAIFTDNLYHATTGGFQLTTDGFPPYRSVIPAILRGRGVDFATLVKVYGTDEVASRRYSPPEVIGTIETAIMGEPEPVRVCTSHVERSNLTLRMQIRRLTRLTNGHSKKWDNHEAAIALFIAYYNFCRVHMTLRKTPAHESGLTSETWSLERLLDEAIRVV